MSTPAKRAAASKAKKLLWRRSELGKAVRRPAAKFMPNERGFRFEKGAKMARGGARV